MMGIIIYILVIYKSSLKIGGSHSGIYNNGKIPHNGNKNHILEFYKIPIMAFVWSFHSWEFNMGISLFPCLFTIMESEIFFLCKYAEQVDANHLKTRRHIYAKLLLIHCKCTIMSRD